MPYSYVCYFFLDINMARILTICFCTKVNLKIFPSIIISMISFPLGFLIVLPVFIFSIKSAILFSL